jgi:hypothetical protein
VWTVAPIDSSLRGRCVLGAIARPVHRELRPCHKAIPSALADRMERQPAPVPGRVGTTAGFEWRRSGVSSRAEQRRAAAEAAAR